ncbi:nose resistant to fluoxetine protein 6-like [Galleria mellonella]|uniref:Nose resistant to fluoxetine protein 6-like n=1 Tax=Galleria mellonella TaxID=7137 RepID=A0A6J3C0M8_GALME|nr:nose resistant to fluoxetine protein 6-like [Galleria mellonella]
MAVQILYILWCTFLTSVSASVVKFNETAFASLPPLYALDDWKQCQRPGDQYCIVDAALVSRHPSPGLMLLQEYSKETLKHYNRTQIHRGVCVTRCGSHENTTGVWDAAQLCLNDSLLKYGLEAEVLSVDWCTTAGASPASSGSALALAALCVVLLTLALLATTLHALGERCATFNGNKYLLAFSMKHNWQILTYDRSKPRSDERMKSIACIEGMRVFGLVSVIFSHALLIYVYSFTDNPEFIENMYDQFVWQTLFNTPIWLQAFFSMSGFLTTYVILITMDEKPITFWKCLIGIINRYIRLTPAAGFALWFIISWYPYLGSGPQWNWMVTREAHDCSERWLYHILYVHNYLEMGKMCMGHTWYLAADMQLHIVGLFLMLLLARYRKAAVLVLPALVIASALAAGLVTYFNELTPIITGQSPEILRTIFAGTKILTMLYLPFWMNLSGYVGGIITAFILHYIQVNGIRLNEMKWFNMLFHIALTLGGCVAMAGTVFLSDTALPLWASSLYAALDRTLITVFFNIFMLGCFSGCKSGLRSMLYWRGFHILGRLSYCVFLVHFIILRLVFAGNPQLGHGSIYTLISLLITIMVLSIIAAIPFCLLVELPAIELWKAITEGDRTERKSTSPVRQQHREPVIHTIMPAVKPMDLLTNVRRRNEV